jgi:hypothetical protein
VDVRYRRALIRAIAIRSVTDSGVGGNPYVKVVAVEVFAGGTIAGSGLISAALKVDLSPPPAK